MYLGGKAHCIIWLLVLQRACEHLASYSPDPESLEGSVSDVPPLTEFFEMVHVGDVIQQMVQLYYDEEIVSRKSRGFRDAKC